MSPDVPSLFHIESQGNVAVATLLPGLSNAPWAEVERAGDRILEQLDRQTVPRCLLDLSPLDYMGSALVALITRVWKSTTARHGQCVVACPNEVPLEVISIAGLDRLWTVVGSRDEGLALLGVGRSSATASSRLGSALAIAAAAGAVVAVVGVVLLAADVIQGTPALALLSGGAACGFAAGLALLMRDPTRRRYVGLIAVVVAAAAAVAGAWLHAGATP